MKFDKKILICALFALMMLCIIGTVSAADSFNENMTAEKAIDEAVSMDIDDAGNEISSADVNDSLNEGEATIYVDGGYSGDEQGTETNPYKTISGAVSKAAGGETIFIKNGDYSENSTIKLDKSLNLVGESKDGVSIKLSQSGTISLLESNVNGATLSFKNLIFKDSASTSGSGIIRFYGSVPMDIKFTDCTFNNLTNKYGLQFMTTGTTSFDGCKFIDMKTSTSNGAGAIYNSAAGTFYINNTIFDSTTFTLSSGQMGAIIYMSQAGSKLYAENITICNYNGPANGIIRSTGTVDIKKSKFINNTVTLSSSGYVGESLFYITSSGKMTMEQCIITGNVLAKNVVYMSSSASITMNYNNIYNNTFDSSYESGFKTNNGVLNADYNYWGSNEQPATPSVNNWVIENNGIFTLNNGDALAKEIPVLTENPDEPVIPSDAIYVAVDGDDNNSGNEDAPVATIAKGVELANNASGFVIIKEGIYTENNIVLDNDKAISIIGRGNVVIDGNASSNSIFKMTGGVANFTNIVFTNNKPRYGGAINVGSGVTINVLIKNCTFMDINSTSRGGAIYGATIKGKLTVTDSKFHNINSGSWGAITFATSSQSDGVEVDIRGSTFENNRANNGAALYLRAAIVNIADSTFVNNSAANAPGAIYVYNATATIDNCVICNNTAGAKGVAISSTPVSGSVTTLTITNSIIENNNGNGQVLPAIYADMNMIIISYSSLVNQLSVETRTATGYDAVYGQGVVIANNNWWGTNDPSSSATGVNVTIDKWVILNVESNVTEVLPGDSVQLTVDFNHVNTTSGEIEELAGGTIPKTYTVDLTTTSGSIAPASLEISNGAVKSAIYDVADIDAVISIASQNAVVNMSFAQAAEPYYGIIYVSKSGDDRNNGSQEAPVATIAKAIELALISGGSGQIIVSKGTYSGCNYRITGNLTISGVGNVVLDAESQGRLFYMNYGDNADIITISNLTVMHVKDNYGAFVYSLAKKLVIDNVTVMNNEGIGTLIRSSGQMTIRDSIFKNMTSGTLIDISGTADILISNTVIESITVDTAGTSNYGIIYAGGKGNLTVESSKINNNTVRQSVIRDSGNTNIIIKDSEFINNHMAGSYADGGAVYAYNKLTVDGSRFINNDACGNGGAISVGLRAQASITKSTFINNSAGSGKKGDAIFSGNKLSITYSVLLSNKSGAVIYHDGEDVANAQYNWWGTNDNPKSLVAVGSYEDEWGVDVDAVIDTSNWVIMTVSNNMTSDIDVGDNVAFFVDFTHYIDSTGTVKDLTDFIPEVDISASAVNGEMDVNKLTTENNIANFIYTALASGNDTVTIVSANAVNVTEINVKESAVVEVIYVSMSGNDDNNGSQSAPVATLKKAIELASLGKIVIMNGNYVIKETLVVDKDLNIEGRGTVTVDGNQLRIFENSANLNLVNIAFTNANAASGSLIYNNANVTLIDCTVFGNNVTGSNGIIQNNKGSLTIDNCEFYGNIASRGVVYAESATKVLINNSNFHDHDMNSKSTNYGIVYFRGVEATVVNTVFKNNRVKNAGSIYISKPTSSAVGSLYVDNCTFEGNLANIGDGGAVYIVGSTEANITNSVFINNSAVKSQNNVGGRGSAVYIGGTANVNIGSSIFVNNTGAYDSAIYVYGGKLTLANSVLLNKAYDSTPAIFKGTSVYNNALNLNDNFWGDNTKANVDAGIDVDRWVILDASYTEAENGELTITATFDKTNSTSGIADYSGILPDGFTVLFNSSTGYLNEVVSVVNGQATTTYTRNIDDSYILVKAGNAEVEFKFTVPPEIVYVSPNGSDNNTGYEDSPVASLAKAVELAKKGQIVILEGTYTTGDLGIVMDGDLNITGIGKVVIDAQNNNRILSVGSDARVVLKNLIMINGYGNIGSGALLGNSNYLTLINCTLANSSAGENNGGAIYNVGKLTIINSTIANNTAREGGAIFANDAMAKDVSIYVENSIFENNVATGNENLGGGAIFAQQLTGLTIAGTTFKNNKADGTSCGGAIFTSHSTATLSITDSEFIANHANGKEGVGGGAIYMVGTSNYERKGTLSISNTLFENNSADSDGGAIYARATTVNIANSVLINNKDANGLAIFGYKTDQVSPSITANDNWWGFNDNPSNLVGGNSNYKPTISRWAILTVANDTAISQGNAVNITVSINTYTTGSENGTLTNPINVQRPVTITTTSQTIDGVLVNGEFTANYVVPSDLKIISASVDNEKVVLFIITTEITVTVNNITADKGDNVKVDVGIASKDGRIISTGNVELYFADDLVAVIPVVNGTATQNIMIAKDIGEYVITAKYIDETGEFANNQSTAVLDVVGIKNIVTPETLSNFFDENGVLKSDVPFDEIIFQGEFTDLGTITINRAINITGDDVLFNNTALKITGDNVGIRDMEFAADNTFADGAVIFISGNDVVLENNLIDYDASNTGDSYAVYIDSADRLNMIDNVIFYDGKLGDNTQTVAVYAIDADDMVVSNNTIVSSVPSVPISYGPAPDYAPLVLSAGIIFDGCNGLDLIDNFISVDYNQTRGQGDTIYGAYVTGSDNVDVIGNDIVLNGHTYAYGLGADGKNINISKNDIESNSDSYYSAGLNINKNSTGVVDSNNISAAANDVVYTIYSNDWYTNTSSVDYTNNNITGEANTVYAMNIVGKDSTIANNDIEATGNYTMGISAYNTKLTIVNNTVNANATNTGNSTGQDPSLPLETTGLYIQSCDVLIENNKVTSTGNSTMDILYSTGSIENNQLKANGTVSDNTIKINGSSVVVGNNTMPTEIKVGSLDISLLLGGSCNINATLVPSAAGALSYSSSDSSIVSVDENGNLFAVGIGNATITISYGGNSDYSGSQATVTVTVTKEPVIRLVVKSSASALYQGLFKVRVLSDGKSIGAGKIVSLRIAGTTIKAKTDKNGYASFKMTSKPNKYSAKVTYGKASKATKIAVKSIIVAKNVAVKKTAKQLVLTATLKKVNGKYLSGKVVRFKFNGKTYSVKTNSKGIAKVIIIKAVLNKLKAGKKYSYIVTYGKDTAKKVVSVKK